MSYSIFYADGAKRDLRDIYSYIAEQLLAPDAASGQIQRIMKGIRSLEEMPMRHRLYEDEPWHCLGLRFFPVDNYLVFYILDESAEIVRIVRIMYGGRNIRRQLEELKEC